MRNEEMASSAPAYCVRSIWYTAKPLPEPSSAATCVTLVMPAAVALANLDIFDEEDLCGNVRRNSPLFRAELETLLDNPIVGDVRGDGYFFAIEFVKDKATKQTFDADERERLLRGFLSTAVFDAGLYCRADDRGNSVLTLAPPLTTGPKEFAEMREILSDVLTRALEVI
jgi:adenosylmethionine-8-amino-7-oxononanoate aminotransferase